MLVDFWTKHERARKPLQRWYDITEKTVWKNFTQLKSTFASADLFQKKGGTFVIFNIAGNRYRLVAQVDFSGTLVIVAVVLTHSQYDQDKWKDVL